MIAKGVEESVLEEYLRALSANAGRFEYLDGQLSMAADAQSIERIERRGRAVLTDLDRKIARLETALEQVRGQLRSQARSSKENQLKTELDGVRELRAKLINLIAESQRSLTRQTELYQAFQESTANVPGAQTESRALQEFKEMTKQKTAEIDRVTEGEAVTW
jgi:paraquat-inducible protein B